MIEKPSLAAFLTANSNHNSLEVAESWVLLAACVSLDPARHAAEIKRCAMASDLYDPKKKDRSVRLRLLARRRLVLGVGLLVLVGLIVLAGRSAQSGKAPKPPAAARRQPDASVGRAPARHPQTPAGSRMADLRSANLMLYRGVGKIETLPGFANANRLLLSTHNRLLWYRYDTDELRVLHEGQVGATKAVVCKCQGRTAESNLAALGITTGPGPVDMLHRQELPMLWLARAP